MEMGMETSRTDPTGLDTVTILFLYRSIHLSFTHVTDLGRYINQVLLLHYIHIIESFNTHASFFLVLVFVFVFIFVSPNYFESLVGGLLAKVPGWLAGFYVTR